MSRVRLRTNIPDSTFSASSKISNVIAGDGRVPQVGERAREEEEELQVEEERGLGAGLCDSSWRVWELMWADMKC